MRDPFTFGPTADDVGVDGNARTAAALYHLARYTGQDADELWGCMQQALLDCIYDSGIDFGDGEDGILADLLAEMAAHYDGKPEACVSWLGSAVASQRKREALAA